MSEIMLAKEYLANTSDTIQAFKEISVRSVNNRKKRTKPEDIKVREGKDGKRFKYVQWSTVATLLDKNFPGWSFEVIPGTFAEYAGYVNCIGKLTVSSLSLSRGAISASLAIILKSIGPGRSNTYLPSTNG